MTEAEKKELRKLQHQLNYGRGINLEQWAILKELRAKDLVSQGLDPNDYHLDSRYCERKNKLSYSTTKNN